MTKKPVSRRAEVIPTHIAADVRDAVAGQRYVQLVRRHRVLQVLVLMAALGAVIVALLGGFRSSIPTTTGPAHSPGSPLQLGAYTVAALSAVVASRMPGPTVVVADTKRLLWVKIRVVNDSVSGSYMGPNLKSSLVLLGADGTVEVQPDQLVWADTGSRDLVLPPRLPVELVAVWELPPDSRAPDHVEVGAYKVVEGISRISLGPEWARGARGGYWRLPVTTQ